jgi:hypothetical protein
MVDELVAISPTATILGVARVVEDVVLVDVVVVVVEVVSLDDVVVQPVTASKRKPTVNNFKLVLILSGNDSFPLQRKILVAPK